MNNLHILWRFGDVFKVCSSTKISLMAMSQQEISFGKYSETWHMCPSIFYLFDVHYLELAVLEQFSAEPVYPQESPRWARVSLRFPFEKNSGTRYICLLFFYFFDVHYLKNPIKIQESWSHIAVSLIFHWKDLLTVPSLGPPCMIALMCNAEGFA